MTGSSYLSKVGPIAATIAVTAISCLVPFIGRAAIGWIVDVNTIGGDEFVVVLEGDDYQNRQIILQNLNEIVEEDNKSDKGVVISCGMAAYEEERGHKFASVFHFADQAMYCRKQELKAVNNKNRR